MMTAFWCLQVNGGHSPGEHPPAGVGKRQCRRVWMSLGPSRVGAEEQINVSPHVLRHTFLRKLAETKGVHYAREASGHQSDRYIWCYVKPDQQTLAEAIDALE